MLDFADNLLAETNPKVEGKIHYGNKEKNKTTRDEPKPVWLMSHSGQQRPSVGFHSRTDSKQLGICRNQREFTRGPNRNHKATKDVLKQVWLMTHCAQQRQIL